MRRAALSTLMRLFALAALAGGHATALAQAVPGVTGGASAASGRLADKWVAVHNDFAWLDQDGNRISTRSGSLAFFDGVWHWYGGNRRFREQCCYTSTDLVHWTNRGVILRHDVEANRIDVLYNDKTKQYVMILKYDGNGAHLGVATSDKPTGPFTFKSKVLVDGALIGDTSVFKDDDGTAYLAYVSWAVGTNAQHGIYRMSDDYLSLDKRLVLWDTRGREANHIFKRNGIYYYGTSKTAMIDSSGTSYYTATNLEGPWSPLQPLETPGSNNSWDSQVDFVFPIQGTKQTLYVYVGDRWIKDHLKGRNGDYIWLPMEFEGDTPRLNYYQDWEVNAATGEWRPLDPSRNLAAGKPVTASSEVGSDAAANVTAPKTFRDYVNVHWNSADSDPQWVSVDLGAPTAFNRVILKWNHNAAKAFKVQASLDGTAWTDVYATTKGSASLLTDETFPTTTARHVRVYATERAPVPPRREMRRTAGNRATQPATRPAELPRPTGYSLFDVMVLKD